MKQRPRIWLALASVVTLVLAGFLAAPAQAVPAAPTISSPTISSLTTTWTVTVAGTYTAKAYTTEAGSTVAGTCSAESTSSNFCVISALANATQYWVSVTGPGAEGESTRTLGTTLTLSPPTGLALSAATATSLSASWDAVTDATSYTATAYDAASGGTAVSTCTATHPTVTCVISSLSNVTTYYVAVNVTKSGTTSADSARVSGTTIAAAPTAPTSVTITGADAALRVSWATPSSDGGAAITGYTAQAWTASSGGSVAESCTTAASTTTCTISPLTNGTTYYVSVFATNSVGPGTSSDRIARTPGSLPGAPRSVTTSRGDGNVTVTWSAPLSEGSSPITSYTARVSTAASSSAEVVGSCTTDGLSCTVSGLTNGTIYYVSVTATSAVGEGGPSSFATIAALNAPTAPRSVTARAGSGYATVTWSAPSSSGGSAITQYVVRAYHVAEGGDPIAICEPKVVTTLRCDIGPLDNGGNYFIDVTARNSLLTGPASTPRVSVITAALATEPRNVTAVQEGEALRVRWQTPTTDGGRPITRYTATAYASPSSTQSLGNCTATGDSCLIKGLEGYVYVDVTATTGAGTGPASQPRVRVFMTGSPDAPRAVSVNQRGRTLVVSWLRPLDDEGIPVAIYTATVRDASGSNPKTCTLYTPQVPKDTDPWAHRFSCSVTGLKVGASYNVTVSAANSVSVISTAPVTARLRASAPSEPRDVSFLPGDDVIGVGALLPSSFGGAKTVTMRFRAWTKETGGKVAATCTTRLGEDDSIGLCRLTRLKNFEPYWIDAVAENAKGVSKPLARIKVEPSPQAPTAPRDFRLEQRGTDFIAAWVEPIFDGGFAVRRYIVRVTNKENDGELVKTCTAKAPELTCDLTGFEAGQHLWFTVVAENTVGESQPSQQLDRTS